MTNRLWETAIERAGALAAPLAFDELPDAELLRRFLAAREEPAFTAIVRRHGPLVWGVCRHLLPSEADAEDAFQATFLVLVRGANKIARPNALAAWLHRVAGRVCRNALRALARRRRHERSAVVAEAGTPVDGATWDRWQLAVHDEIDRLPDALRVPFVLCVLQGVRQPEAARRLGWKLGTVSGRVCKAKQALTGALTRRGLTGPAVLVGVVGAAGPLSAGLVGKGTTVVRSGAGPGGTVSPAVHELARGAMGGLMSKTKLLAAAVLTATLAIGVGREALPTADAQTPGPGPGSTPGGPQNLVGESAAGLPPGQGTTPQPKGSGSGMMPGGSAGRGPRVEYHFVAKPKGADAFKKLLTQQGADGWEYAGLVPGDDELIFKRTARPGGVMSGAPGGMPGMGGFGGFSGMGMPGAFGGTPGSGFGGGFGPGQGPGGFGTTPGPKGAGSGMNPFAGDPDPKGPVGGQGRFGGAAPAGGTGAAPMTGGPGEGGLLGMGEGAGAAPGAATNLTIRAGETIRHRMKTNHTIDRVHSDNPKSVEVTLDPTDAKRVLIRGLTTSGARVELTDEKGAKERYVVHVR